MIRSADKTASRVIDTPQPLPVHEWKFDDVPREEIEACYLYEYAREFFKNSEHLQQFLREWNDPDGKREGKHFRALGKATDLLRTRCKNFPYLDFDFFPQTAWQDLPVLPRTAHRGFEIDLRHDAAEHVNEWAALHRQSPSDRLDIETLRESEPPNIRTIEAFRDCHEFFHANLGKKDLANTEYGFFAINWDFKDAPIIAAFTHWLDEQRRARKAIGLKEAKPTVSRGGFTDKLKWLGALRVKDHYRHRDLVDHADTNLKVDAPYSHYPDLLDAAKKAAKEITRLFPSQWSEKEFRRRQAEADRFHKKHPMVLPEALLRGASKGVSSKS